VLSKVEARRGFYLFMCSSAQAALTAMRYGSMEDLVQRTQNLCSSKNVPLVDDEVQRTGTLIRPC